LKPSRAAVDCSMPNWSPTAAIATLLPILPSLRSASSVLTRPSMISDGRPSQKVRFGQRFTNSGDRLELAVTARCG
jgi:hypothetical protein